MVKGKLVALGLALVMILSLVGCGQQAATSKSGESAPVAKKKVVIGFSMPTFDDKWLSYMLNAAQDEGKSLTDAEIIFVDAKNDTAKQMAQVENFIAQKVDAIVVCPVDTDATEPLTKAAKAANIPLLSVNRVFKNQDQATAYVGSDSIQSGILQMEYVGKQLGGKGNIVILRGDDGQEAARLRTQGVKQVIKEKYPDIKVVAEQTGKWQRPLGMTITENWIQSGIKFDAVLANNDEMAIGAIMALKDAKIIDKVFVAGIDATPDALQFMKEGTLKVTVFQNAKGQGAGAVKAAYKVAKGETIEKNVMIPYELVTPEKIDEYIAKWN